MTTANEIFKQALSILQVRPAGGTIGGNEIGDLLTRLNMLVDSWRTQSLYSYSTTRVSKLVQGGTQSLTIGPTGDIVTTYRPIRIESGSFFTTGGRDYEIADVLTNADYMGIADKALGGLGPTRVFYDAGLPNGTLYLYPVPSATVTLSLHLLTEVVDFATAQTDYTLAPGYARALAYGLAEDLQGDYGASMDASALRASSLAKRNIRRVNHVAPTLSLIGRRSKTLGELFSAPALTSVDGGSA